MDNNAEALARMFFAARFAPFGWIDLRGETVVVTAPDDPAMLVTWHPEGHTVTLGWRQIREARRRKRGESR